MSTTKIEWTDAVWNPVRGCNRISPGCQNCYAEIMAARFNRPGQWGEGFATIVRDADGKALDHRWTGEVAVHWPAIDLPFTWRRPRRIFVNSTSDLFHARLTDTEIATIFAVAIAAHHLRGHTFQILTKRADRMRATLSSPAFWEQVNAEVDAHVMDNTDPLNRTSTDARTTCAGDYGPDKPPPGIWLGVSVEDQLRADERIIDLLRTPAALRFLSVEPMLGPVDLINLPSISGIGRYLDCLSTAAAHGSDVPFRIDWVICGGESGPGARPMHPDWARDLRDQCVESRVPFFFKQWGEWAPAKGTDGFEAGCQVTTKNSFTTEKLGDDLYAVRVGKKAAGRLLDGLTWDQVPGGAA